MAVSAEGLYIRDDSGKHYLDMSGGAAVSALGHAHPDVLEAIRSQLSALDFAHTSFFTNRPQEQLANRLAQRFGDPGSRVYFTSGGSEANETALKLCWQFWAARGQAEKKVIVSREHSYHGNTFGALSVSGNAARRKASAAPLLDWPRISPCYALRGKGTEECAEDYVQRITAELESAINQVGAERVAAFICEPIVGASLGAVAAEPGYLKRIREICDRYDVLWIADEVMCGSGRTGPYFAFEREGARPDIVTLAKGIGAGYLPLAATILSGRVAQIFDGTAFVHGHTYIGHPVTCAAGVAVQDVIDRDNLLERTTNIGAEFGAMLHERFGTHRNVYDIRGRGLFWAIEFAAERERGEGFRDRPGLPQEMLESALKAGLIVYPGSIQVDGACVPHLLLAPPMIVENSHMQECVDKLRQLVDDVFGA